MASSVNCIVALCKGRKKVEGRVEKRRRRRRKRRNKR
jgi:ASC-1-like (ASCH) protein